MANNGHHAHLPAIRSALIYGLDDDVTLEPTPGNIVTIEKDGWYLWWNSPQFRLGLIHNNSSQYDLGRFMQNIQNVQTKINNLDQKNQFWLGKIIPGSFILGIIIGYMLCKKMS